MPILTPLTRLEFQKILDDYHLGTYKSHKHFAHALSNTIYKVTTSQHTLILKFFEHEDKQAINLQIKIMKTLEKKNLSPKLYKTPSQKIISHFKKPFMIQEYFEGKEVKRLTSQETKDFGIFLAYLHLCLKKLKITPNPWKIGYQFKRKESSYQSPTLDLDTEFKHLYQALQGIPQDQLHLGIIHGDLSGANILKNRKGRIMLCDWDDARKDYLVYDLAVFIGNLMVQSQTINQLGIRNFFQGYQTLISFNESEKHAMYYFILNSLLWGLEYGSKQKEIHKEKERGIVQWMLKHEKKYLMIKKLGLQKFLTYF